MREPLHLDEIELRLSRIKPVLPSDVVHHNMAVDMVRVLKQIRDDAKTTESGKDFLLWIGEVLK